MNWINKIQDQRYLFFLFIFLIPFHSYLGTRVVLLLFVIAILPIRHFNFSFVIKSWDVYFYFLALCFGLLFTTSLNTGLSVIETNLCLIAIPVLFIKMKDFDEKLLDRFFYWFTMGLLVTCFICLVNATINYSRSNNVASFFFYEFTSILSLQPIYLAYYLIFALTYCLYYLYYKKSNINPLAIAVVLIFLFSMLVLTGGQTAFISILFVFSFFILKFLVEARSVNRNIAFGLICIMMACMFFISLKDQGNTDLALNDSWERFVLWEAAIKAIPNVLWGVGTGDYKDVLNNYYLTHDLNRFAQGNYNSHNQFIQSLLTNGLLGLLSVVILICRPLYLSVKNNNILGVLVFFPFLIYGMTEVFLGRYQGIVFFALLHQVFISHYSTVKPTTSKLKAV